MSVELLTARDMALVEAVARRVLELLDERDQQQPSSPRLVDATELARLLGVSRSTVYERAGDLGAMQLGDGPRPRLRFDVETARAAWTRRVSSERSQAPKPPAPAPIQRPSRRRRPAVSTPLWLRRRWRQAADAAARRTPQSRPPLPDASEPPGEDTASDVVEVDEDLERPERVRLPDPDQRQSHAPPSGWPYDGDGDTFSEQRF